MEVEGALYIVVRGLSEMHAGKRDFLDKECEFPRAEMKLEVCKVRKHILIHDDHNALPKVEIMSGPSFRHTAQCLIHSHHCRSLNPSHGTINVFMPSDSASVGWSNIFNGLEQPLPSNSQTPDQSMGREQGQAFDFGSTSRVW